MCPIEADWPKTVWNGVVLRHPPSWEVTRLDHDQVLWSEASQAALEIRWTLVRGRFDLNRSLRRFGRRARRKGLPLPEPWSVPQSWRTCLSEFRLAGFHWRRSDAQGCGLLVYCPQCRRQSLIQFHPHLLAQPHLIPPLLASFRDHPKGKEGTLSLFGIRARLPGGLQLVRFRFDTGRYRLSWRKGRRQIGLHRWAPAGVVLARQPLAVFVGQQFKLPPRGLTPIQQRGFTGVESRWTTGIPLPASLGHYRMRRILRVWHVDPHNCLLGVEAQGRGRGLTSLLEQVCNSYEAF